MIMRQISAYDRDVRSSSYRICGTVDRTGDALAGSLREVVA
jgi:hypothetical protein